MKTVSHYLPAEPHEGVTDRLRAAIWATHEQGKHVAVVTDRGGLVHVPFGYTLEAFDAHEVVLRAPGGLLVHYRPERPLTATPRPERRRAAP